MKPYKGIFKVECLKGEKPCPKKYVGNVNADCVDCEMGELTVLNLKGEGVHKKKGSKGSRIQGGKGLKKGSEDSRGPWGK